MKGIVVEVNENAAIMLSNTGEFVNVKNKNYEVGQKIRYFKNVGVSISAVASAILLFCAVGFAGWKFYTKPVSFVDVEINPHIRIELNAFEKVVNVVPLNYDAQALIEAVQKPNPDIKMCIQDYLDQAKELGFINSDNKEIDIEVSSADEDSFNRVVSMVSSMAETNTGLDMTINDSKTADVEDDEEDDEEDMEEDENENLDVNDSDSEDEDEERDSSEDDEDSDDKKSSSKSSKSSSKKTEKSKSSDEDEDSDKKTVKKTKKTSSDDEDEE